MDQGQTGAFFRGEWTRKMGPKRPGNAMKRRVFIALAGSAAVLPLVARAQQLQMPTIGFLHSASADSYASQVNAFRQSLKQSGYVESQNVKIEYRWAENEIARLGTMATELVSRRVSIIVAGGSPASALAAKSATTTIPIVFMNVADPVELGLVASFNRPGGNITGATLLSAELVAKRVGLLRDLLPSIKRIAMLVNPTRPGVDAQKGQVQGAAQALGLAFQILEASSEREFEPAFRTMSSQQDGALIVAPDALFVANSAEIADLATRYRVATMFELRNFAEAGGLISYGASAEELYRLGGTLTGQILMGKKPADLPVLQPTKFELVINMKTARALGLTVSPGLLSIADELIE
jgi:putative tryptophan/tyrosine transport system substrate-binding protein